MTIPEPGDHPLNLDDIALLLGASPDEEVMFANYIEYVANEGLLPYKAIVHDSGPKAGESLYTHILNGIMILQQLRPLLHLSELEAQVLLTAYTIHDINKMLPEGETRKYADLATRAYVEPLIPKLQLDRFFPDYTEYLEDILHLMRGHSGHLNVGLAQALDRRNAGLYGLDKDRVEQLVLLMKAADEIDLSQTLEEQPKKAQFLSHLNTFSDTQYTFVAHRVSEQRGNFTNIIHNAVMEEMSERAGLTPLLLYPEGVAYLCPRGTPISLDDATQTAIAQRAADMINTMTGEGFEQFVKPGNMGISVDRKCLDLGISFEKIFGVVETIIQKRPYKRDKREQLEDDATNRARQRLAKRATAANPLPADDTTTAEIERLLEAGPLPQTAEGLRVGELLRTYYIFLLEHFKETVPNAWQHLYNLLDIAPEHAAVYDGFDARMDRAYVIAADSSLTADEIHARIWHDGKTMLAATTRTDPRTPRLQTYLQQVLSFSGTATQPEHFAAALPNYIARQHHQCVQCSLPLPTEHWVSGDVRSDVKVQVFSNRLKGGPGEPKRNVCGICQVQFLVEKLNYREVRGEQSIYLHLFPYSFQTAPFVKAIRRKMAYIDGLDPLSGALRLNDAEKALLEAAHRDKVALSFTTRTKEDKAQPYGLYVPRYAETLGSVMTFPINAVGENDTEQFLFAMQYALLLQRHFGCKVLMSRSVTPPLDKEAFGDIYFDMTPLSGRGLIRHNDYTTNGDDTSSSDAGSLTQLWKELGHLYTIQRAVLTRDSKPLLKLVTALAEQPLHLFHAAERLAEAKAGSGRDAGWIMRTIADDVRSLAISKGDHEMHELDEHLQRLAEIAWQGGLRGETLKKNSLMAPMDEVLRKMSLLGQELTPEVIRAAAAQDLYEHLARIHKAESLRRHNACVQFVDRFFDEVFEGVYHGKLARLMNHEKVLRSAFHFYIRQQIPRKAAAEDTDDEMEQDETTTQTDMNDLLADA